VAVGKSKSSLLTADGSVLGKFDDVSLLLHPTSLVEGPHFRYDILPSALYIASVVCTFTRLRTSVSELGLQRLRHVAPTESILCMESRSWEVMTCSMGSTIKEWKVILVCFM
jgi:hypothetical protein